MNILLLKGRLPQQAVSIGDRIRRLLFCVLLAHRSEIRPHAGEPHRLYAGGAGQSKHHSQHKPPPRTAQPSQCGSHASIAM